MISVSILFSINFLHPELDNYDIPSVFYLRVEYSDHQSSFKTYSYFFQYIFNDIVILVLNLFIDVLLVKTIKKELKCKINTQTRIINSKSGPASELERKKIKKDEERKVAVERKVNLMIVISVILYIFCRVPEVIGIFVFYYFYDFSYTRFCISSVFCYLASNVIEYMYMVSYILNIFLYYKFNTFFKRGFRNFFGINDSKKHNP